MTKGVGVKEMIKSKAEGGIRNSEGGRRNRTGCFSCRNEIDCFSRGKERDCVTKVQYGNRKAEIGRRKVEIGSGKVEGGIVPAALAAVTKSTVFRKARKGTVLRRGNTEIGNRKAEIGSGKVESYRLL